MPSASSPNPFVSRSVTLTDAQIKALPVTPVRLVSPTQTLGYSGVPSTLPTIVSAVAFIDSRAGGYTNVASGSELTFAWGSDWSMDIATARRAGGQASDILSVLSAAEFRWLAFPLPDQAADSNLNNNLQDNAIVLAMGNVGLGALTGGNAANTLTVQLAYTVTHLPT